MKRKGTRDNENGATLIEVIIAMVILTVFFFGIMGLSMSIIQNNGDAQHINQATQISQLQTSQFDCLGASGIQSYLTSISKWPLPIWPNTYNYSYNISSTTNGDPIIAGSNWNGPACITLVNGSAQPVTGLTQPFAVSVSLSQNSLSSTLINITTAISWNNEGIHQIVFNEVVS